MNADHRDSFAHFLQRYKNYISLAWIFALYLIAYGAMMFRYGYSIEEILEGVRTFEEIYIINMRWGVALWRCIMGQGAMPVTGGIIAGIFISAAILFQIKLFKLQGIARFIYAIIYLSAYSHWLGYLRFSVQSDCVGMAMFATSAAIYLLRNHNKCRYFTIACAILMLAFGTSVYQSNVTYAAALWLACFIQDTLANVDLKKRISQTLYFLCVLIGSVCAYYIIGKLVIAIYMPLEAVKKSGLTPYYVNGMFGWQNIADMTPYDIWIRVLGIGFFTPLKNILGMIKPGQWISATALLAFFFIFIKLCRSGSKLNTLIFLVSCGTLLYIPFCMNILVFNALPNRAFIAQPIVPAVAWAFCAQIWQIRGKAIPWIICICLLLITKASYASSRFAYNERYAFERGKEEAIAMDSRSRAVALAASYKTYNIILLGNPPLMTSIESYSLTNFNYYKNQAHPFYLAWPRWLAHTVSPYFRLNPMKRGDEQDMQKHRDAFNQMPVWPQNGSVRASGGDVIIRIGDAN